MLRRAATLGTLLFLVACAAPAPSSVPAAPTPVPQETLSAQTAAAMLRGTTDLEDRRLLAISSDFAPRGLATTWRITMVSIIHNEITTYEVAPGGVIGEPTREPYNAVFDTQAPPFLEDAWQLDSTDAARQLPDPGAARMFLLEADEEGVLYWSVVLEDFSGIMVRAGETPLDTPLPTNVGRVRR